MRTDLLTLILSLTALPGLTSAAPAPEEILRRADAVIGAEQNTSLVEMRTLRRDGSEKLYRLRIHKLDATHTRVEFLYPAVEKGRRLLRRGDDMWMMLKTIKRPLRISAKQKLMNGDFDNGDVLRLNLLDDYVPSLKGTEDGTYLLELKANDRTVSYDRVLLWVDVATSFPKRAQYFTVSGRLVRELEYTTPKSFGGHRRPSVLVMRNMLDQKSRSVMTLLEFENGTSEEPSFFTVNALRR